MPDGFVKVLGTKPRYLGLGTFLLYVLDLKTYLTYKKKPQ